MATAFEMRAPSLTARTVADVRVFRFVPLSGIAEVAVLQAFLIMFLLFLL